MSRSRPAASSRSCLKHAAFQDPRNDILVRSAGVNPVLFPYRRIWLEVASTVLEDLLANQLDGRAGGPVEQVDGLPVVDIPEAPLTLERFLVFAHPQMLLPEIDVFEELILVCDMAAVYESRGIIRRILQCGVRYEDEARILLALGVIFQEPPTIEWCLWSAFTSKPVEFSTDSETRETVAIRFSRFYSLGFIDAKLVARISPQAWKRLLQAEEDHLRDSSQGWHGLIEALNQDPAFLDRPLP